MSRNFNGSSDKIITASNFSWPATSFSVSWWLYSTSWVGNQAGCVSGAPSSGLIRCGFTGNSSIIQSTTAVFQLVSTTSFNINSGTTLIYKFVWNNIICVYDTTNGAVLYVNGVSTATNAAVGSINTTANNPIWIGDDRGLNRLTAGNMADVAIWNVTLTAAEVSALALGARPHQIRRSALLAWWPLTGFSSPEPDLIARNSGNLTGTGPGFNPPYMAFTPRWPQGGILPTFTPPQAAGVTRMGAAIGLGGRRAYMAPP